MRNILKAEFMKIVTIRSTYVLLFFAVALTVLFSFYFEGYKGNTGSAASELQSTAFREVIMNSSGLAVMFITIIVILYTAHEYRYNTIIYTLTSSVNRTKALVSKMIVATLVSVAVTVGVVLIAVVSYRIGVAMRGGQLPAQEFNIISDMGRVVFYCTAYALVGMVIASIARSINIAIAVFMIYPITVEPLIGLLLDGNAKYLPFTVLDSINGTTFATNVLSPNAAVAIGAGYLLVASTLMWVLFTRRDAN